MDVLTLRVYLLAGDLSVEESFVDAGAILLSAGEAEVLHGRGVFSTDRLWPVTSDPPYASIKRFDVVRQTGTEVCEPKCDKRQERILLKGQLPACQ